MLLQPGTRLGSYEITSLLGSGGMGQVYRAKDDKLGRDVAIKVLREDLASDPERLCRFEQEARSASALNHPNIITIYSIDKHEETPYIAMELVEGETLRVMLAGGPLPAKKLLVLAKQMAEGLAKAHSAGIVHRDLKPENLMVSRDGYVKILDFGLAKLLPQSGVDPEAATAIKQGTVAGAVIGTASYMSPEQALGKPLDARTDVFSLGTVLYEMATATKPFQGETAAALFDEILHKVPVSPSALNQELPRNLAEIIHKALEKDPQRRPATQELLANLESISEAPPIPESPQQKSIVVLPFENMSPDPEQEYFCDGMTEEIITDLSKLKSLRVISRTSSMRLKGTDKDIRIIGKELDVQYVLEGSVRKAGNSLRITAQLIDSTTDAHLWAEKYSGVLEDVFDIQEKVSRAIVDELELKLTPEEERRIAERPITDIHTYETYLLARRAIWSFDQEEIERAFKEIENAMAELGENELLTATLGYLHTMLVNTGLQPDRYIVNLEKAESYAKRTFALNPNSPHGHSLMGWVHFHRGEVQDSVRELNKAYAGDSNNLDTLMVLHYGYAIAGKISLARDFVEKLVKADPLNPINQCMPGFVEIMDGRFEAALPYYRKMSQMDPKNQTTQLFLAWTLSLNGLNTEVVEAVGQIVDLNPESIAADMGRFLKFALLGEEKKALESVTSQLLGAGRGTEFYARFLTDAYALADQKDEAIDWLETDIGLGFINYPYLSQSNPLLANIRGEARFKELMKKVKIQWQNFEV
jgi:serine/threonine protein kinase/tetratricopeptide (TPR) repeat protein